MGQIVDEAGYQRSLKWLVSKSAMLDDPLIDEAAKTNLRAQYDLVSEKVKEYRRGELAAKFPGLKEQYKILGWSYQEMPSQAEQEAPVTEAEQTQTNTPTSLNRLQKRHQSRQKLCRIYQAGWTKRGD